MSSKSRAKIIRIAVIVLIGKVSGQIKEDKLDKVIIYEKIQIKRKIKIN